MKTSKAEAKKRMNAARENWRNSRGTSAEALAWDGYLNAFGYYLSFD